MKSKNFLIITCLTFLLSFQSAESQDIKNFPFNPFVILKSWNYDFLLKTMGNGEEIIGTMRNQTYLAGLKYPADLLGMHGKLEFTFVKDSISRFQFTKEHETRVISSDLADRKTRDPAVSLEYKSAMQKLDSLQKLDSFSRDSVVKAISEILGTPLSNGRTAITEKNARYSAVWINRGYSCLYKDYIDFSEIVFTLSTVPLLAVGEFDIPTGTEILRKVMVNTRKMSWSASLLGFPSDTPKMIFSDVFLLLEFATGQKYLVSLPKNAIDFLSRPFFLEFPAGQRCLMLVPQNGIGYLPLLTFEDCDGDAIPEAWIQVPFDLKESRSRHYLFSLQYKEPNLIFNSDEQIPSAISIQNGSRIMVTLQDGTTRVVESPMPIAIPNQGAKLYPKGFKYFNSTKLNTDGSTNFIGGIELRFSKGTPSLGVLEITYKHSSNGWEADQIKMLKHD